MKKWQIKFDENGGEYTGFLIVTANDMHADEDDETAFFADSVHVKIDERITSIDEINEA